MDHDVFDADDYAGCLSLSLADVTIEMDQNNIPPPQDPTWMQFFLEKPGDLSGELLVSYQVIIFCRTHLIIEMCCSISLQQPRRNPAMFCPPRPSVLENIECRLVRGR